MYYVRKKLEISAAHSLELDYKSSCKNLHGHNWIIYVYCKSEKVNETGMVIDFQTIKNKVHSVLDHQYLNEIFIFNPTAENIAKWIVDSIPSCYRAKVIESEKNEAIYEKV